MGVRLHVAALPEVQTQGENLHDARVMAEDAIALMLEERRRCAEPIPQTGWALVRQSTSLRDEA